MKVCPKCKELKSDTMFYRASTGYLAAYCRECENQRKRTAYKRSRKLKDGIKIREDGVKVIHKGNSTKIYWDGNMLSIMKLHFPDSSNEEMFELLGGLVSIRTIRRKAKEMGLEKTPEWLQRANRDNLTLARVEAKKTNKTKTVGRSFMGNQYVNADGTPKKDN